MNDQIIVRVGACGHIMIWAPIMYQKWNTGRWSTRVCHACSSNRETLDVCNPQRGKWMKR